MLMLLAACLLATASLTAADRKMLVKPSDLGEGLNHLMIAARVLPSVV